MTDHYRVFISSTYLDNVKRREVVLEAIERAGRMVAVRMERFTADDRPTVGYQPRLPSLEVVRALP